MPTPVRDRPPGLLAHYRQLWFFNFHRFQGDNYANLREYFAGVAIRDLETFIPLQGKSMLDIGGARGEFCKAFHELRGCRAVNLDPCPDNPVWPGSTIGSADQLPFREEEFDVILCRGVLEHVPTEKQLPAVREMQRVLKRDGICCVVIPPWHNPHAGHGLKPFHIFGFRIAKRLREVFFRQKIEAVSFAEMTLYPITFRRMVKHIARAGFRILGVKDTHFRLHWLTRVPLLREIAVPAAAFYLQRIENQ